MELFKCQAVLLFLAVAVYGILADSEPDNGKLTINAKQILYEKLKFI